MDTFHQDGVQALGALEQRLVLGGEPQVGADTLDVVVHPDLAVGQDLDIDRGGRPVADDGVTRPVIDLVPIEHLEEQRRVLVADPADEAERQP
jgi:hypothetical protein